MKVGLISDTHDRLPTLHQALDLFRARGIETLIHPGDIIAPFAAKPLNAYPGTVHVTYGNNDGERDGLRRVLPQIVDGPLKIEIAGRRILVHHFIDWCESEDLAAAEIVITGHTHQYGAEQVGDRLQINPGECCGWVTGHATVAILDLTSLELEWITLAKDEGA